MSTEEEIEKKKKELRELEQKLNNMPSPEITPSPALTKKLNKIEKQLQQLLSYVEEDEE